MKAKKVIKLLIPLACTFLLSACIPSNKTVKYDEFKLNLNCISYEAGMHWKTFEESFAEPDYTPIPTGESLSQNIRIYKDKFIFVHTELKKIKVDGRTRYEEVVNILEICGK